MRNWSDLATRSGVFRRPSLSVSSPRSRSISLTWTAISAVVSLSYMSSDLYAISLVVIINVYTNREEFFSTIAMTGTKLHKNVHYMEFLYIFAARTRIHWYPVGY